MAEFGYTNDEEGIVTVCVDLDGPVRIPSSDFSRLLAATVDRLEKDSGLTGVIFSPSGNTSLRGGPIEALVRRARWRERSLRQGGSHQSSHATVGEAPGPRGGGDKRLGPLRKFRALSMLPSPNRLERPEREARTTGGEARPPSRRGWGRPADLPARDRAGAFVSYPRPSADPR